MGIFTNYFGTTGTRSVVLAGGSTGQGKPIAIVKTKGYRTINFPTINYLYETDSTTYNSINLMVNTIMAAGFQFMSKEKDVERIFNEFFDNIGIVDTSVTKWSLIRNVYSDLFKFGNSFMELIYNKKGNKVVDLRNLEAKNVDYARDGEGNVALDEFGNPIGYVLLLDFGQSNQGQGDQVPEKYKRSINLESQMIFMLPFRIAHFKMNEKSNRLWGVGVLEPVIQAILRKQALEEAQSNSIYTRGTSPVIGYVGDAEHEATPDQLEEILETLSNMKHDRYFTFPNFVRVETLDVKTSSEASDFLMFLDRKQASAAGIPLPFATSSGEATNRATLNNQQQIFDQVLEYYVSNFIQQFENQVLRRLKVENGYKDIPMLVWGDVKAEEKDAKSKRLHLYVLDGVIAPEEIRPYVLKSENIKSDEVTYKTYINYLREKGKVPNSNKNVPEIERDQVKREITTKKQ